MTALVARAPTRLDFGGGWTDVPPYSDEEGGFVCNVAIARYATVSLEASTGPATHDITRAADSELAAVALRRAGLRDVRMTLDSDFPVGAGLGGSSAAGVAVAAALHAWRREPFDRAALAEESRQVEVEDLQIAGGRQDHYAAAFGGALALQFRDATMVTRIPLDDATRAALERRCVVGYTGQSRISGTTITGVLDAYRSRAPSVLESLRRMRELAEAMARALRDGDIDALAEMVEEHWHWQRALHPAIPTPLIDDVLARARNAGALGGKALGASAGGCVLVIARDTRVDDVREVVDRMTQRLEFTIDEAGVAVRRDGTVDG